MGDLAVIVPSRGRPGNIARLQDAMDRTCRGFTTLIVGVDDDDPCLAEYRTLIGSQLVVRKGLQRQLVRWLNVLAVPRAQKYAFLGHIGDDNVPRTDGWDVRIMESLERHQFCFGDDLDPGRTPGSLSIHIFMRSQVVRRLGYMGPPSIQHMYVDPVWYAWGKATSIDFLPDVVLEHMHYSLGRSPMDESYQHSTGLIPSDCTNYNDYCDDPAGLNADIAKLGGTPFTVEALAEFNRGLNIPAPVGSMTVSVLLATMGRPEQAEAFVHNLRETTEGHGVEIVVAVDGPGEHALALSELGCVVDHATEPRGSSRAWNDALALATGDPVVLAADDLEWQPGWLDAALTTLSEFPDGWGFVGFNDGHWGPELSTHYLMSRRFVIECLGGVIAWEAYHHSFNDREANARAHAAGRYAWSENARVYHRHWSFGERPQDSTDSRLLVLHPKSQQTFEQREAAGFPNNYEPVLKEAT